MPTVFLCSPHRSPASARDPARLTPSGAFLLLKCSQALEKEKKMWYNYGDGNVAVKIIRLHS